MSNQESNIYYDKYLKYKMKCLEFKKKINFNENNHIQQKGNGYFYEQNDLIKRINMLGNNKFKKDLYQFSSIYLKTNITNQHIIKKYNKIRKIILKNNTPPPFNYHMTLLIFEINLDYPSISNSISYFDKTVGKKKVRKTLSFLDPEEIKLNFETIFKNMILESIDYEVVGKLKKIKLDSNREINLGIKNQEQNDCIEYPGLYFVDKFDVNNKNLITTFRIKFYEKLNEFMKFEFMKLGGKTKDYIGYRVDNEIDPDYILIFYDNFSKTIPLIAIKKFYYGKNTWMPHITIFNIEELIPNNKKFVEKYVVEYLTNKNRNKLDQFIFDELKNNILIKELFKKNNKTRIMIEDMKFELQV